MRTTRQLTTKLAMSLTAIALLVTVVFAAPPPAQAQTSQDSIVILLDVSGSMNDASQQDPTRSRIEVATDALTEIVSAVPDSSIELGLRTFSGCATSSSTLLNPVEVADASHKADILSSIAGVTAGGETNITNGLTQALTDLPPGGERTILLVSDGEHNCGPDPCVAIQNIIASGVQVRVNTIGLELEDSFFDSGPGIAELELRCISAASGGYFQSADNLEQLQFAIFVGLSPIVTTPTSDPCRDQYTLTQGACVFFNPGQTANTLVMFVCPLVPGSDVQQVEDSWYSTTFIEYCFYPLTCDGAPVTVHISAGDTPTNGDDVIMGTMGPDVINAGDGDDIVCSAGGDDIVTGGNGNDVLIGGVGNDQLIGGDGDDTLIGAGGRDVIRGGPGSDALNGGNGNDRLTGGIGDDVLNGGNGNDFLGGFGGADTINGDDGADVIFGGFGADTIDGGNGADEIHGLVGNDVISGGNGNDDIDGDRGNDTIDGDAGDDVIRGGNANDVLRGGDGNDTLGGGKADDQLSGGAGIDSCVGNAENFADSADSTCEAIFGVP